MTQHTDLALPSGTGTGTPARRTRESDRQLRELRPETITSMVRRRWPSHSWHDCQDAVQSAILEHIEGPTRFDPDKGFLATFIAARAGRLLTKESRRKKPDTNRDAAVTSATQSRHEGLAAEALRLREIIGSLPDKAKAVAELTLAGYSCNLSAKEIARRVGSTESSVRVMQFRFREIVCDAFPHLHRNDGQGRSC
ncbi:MAG: sigma-70 family RNA polymerase sigma factor [Phycisphaera sp.]|nr:MAG: sigma-70 family RNA polymerase sigma factor [Phycisphaera sp.]